MNVRIVPLLVCLALAAALPALAGIVPYSHLSLPVAPAGRESGELLAQRTIDREWGMSEDSTYHEVDVPGWKSEGLALALSGALPGAGQLYLDNGSGWAFLAAEAAGWFGHWYERRSATQEWRDLAAFVGDPNDPSSVFAFERYTANSGHDASDLRALWDGDRNAFYRAIHDDPTYFAGFRGPYAQSLHGTMHNMIDAHDLSLGRARLIDTALLFNHLVAAVDAWRAARANNAPLREQYHLELGSRWRGSEREYRAALVRRF
jgi:hypothetical protein